LLLLRATTRVRFMLAHCRKWRRCGVRLSGDSLWQSARVRVKRGRHSVLIASHVPPTLHHPRIEAQNRHAQPNRPARYRHRTLRVMAPRDLGVPRPRPGSDYRRWRVGELAVPNCSGMPKLASGSTVSKIGENDVPGFGSRPKVMFGVSLLTIFKR